MADFGHIPGELLARIVNFMGIEKLEMSLFRHRSNPLFVVNRHWRKCLEFLRKSRASIRNLNDHKVGHHTKNLVLAREDAQFDDTTRLERLFAIGIPAFVPTKCLNRLECLELAHLDAEEWFKLELPFLKKMVLKSVSGLETLGTFLVNHPFLESLSVLQMDEIHMNNLKPLRILTRLTHLSLHTSNLDLLELIATLRPSIEQLELVGTRFRMQESTQLALILSKFTNLILLDLSQVPCGLSALLEPNIEINCSELRLGTHAYIQSLPIRSFCERYRGLNSLILNNNTPLSDHALSVITKTLVNLEVLELPSGMGLITPSTLMSIPTRLRELKNFKAPSYPITSDVLDSFAVHSTKLTRFITPRIVKHEPIVTLARIESFLQKLKGLEILDISQIQISDRDITLLQKRNYRTLIITKHLYNIFH